MNRTVYFTGLLLGLIFFSCKRTQHSEQNKRIDDTNRQQNKIIAIKPIRSLNADTVEGIYSSEYNNNLIYKKPFSWASDEIIEGALFIKNLKTKISKKLLDSIDVNGCYSDVLDSSSFIITSGHTIYLYKADLDKKELIYDMGEREIIEAIRLSQDKKIISILTWNINKNKVNLYLMTVKSKMIVYEKSWNFIQVDEDGGVSGSIYWINDNIIFNINNGLYILNVDSKLLSKLTSDLAFNNVFQFAVNSSKIIFYEGNLDRYSLKYYDIIKKEYGSATFNLQTKVLKLDYTTNLCSSIFNNEPIVFLQEGSINYRLDHQSWKMVGKVNLFEDRSVTISKYQIREKLFIITE